MMTYGDGVAEIDLKALLAFHRAHGRLATVTAVRPPARFGALALDGDRVASFSEKPQGGEGWINGGFFVLEPGVLDYLDGDATVFEQDALETLAGEGQLGAYRHEGFWQCMDTLRDVRQLNAAWEQDSAPWAVWKKGVITG
jgi:glucose-1-phosphate cytidylyltransferase